MTIVSSFLFAFAGIAAIATIWKTLTAALPVISALHRDLATELDGHAISVTTLDTREVRRPARPRRRLQAKPVTHRLHQYPHHTHAA